MSRQQIAFHSPLHLSSCWLSTLSGSLSASESLHGLLRDNTLYLHRGNPLVCAEDVEEVAGQDGAEVGRLVLHEHKWKRARRRLELDEDGRWAVELSQTDTGAATTKSSGRGSLSRKKSNSALSESTNNSVDSKSFANKLAARMKRGKSISSTAPVLESPSPHEPLLFFVNSLELAEDWVVVLNNALRSATLSPPPASLTPSASLPALSSLASSSSSSSRTSSRRPQTGLPFTLPPGFNAGRRPSWLDRPPPTPSSYSTGSPAPTSAPPSQAPASLTEARNRSSSDVPAWIAATLAAGDSHKEGTRNQTATFPPPTQNRHELRARRSMSFLQLSGTPPVSVPMDRSRSDGRSSMDAPGKGRLLGLIKRSSKRSTEVSDVQADLGAFRMGGSSSRGSSPRPGSRSVASKSTTSLSDSLLSDSHSTTYSSDRPTTPAPQDPSPQTTPRPKSPYVAPPRTPRTYTDVQELQRNLGASSQTNHLSDTSRFEDALPSASSHEPQLLEPIIKPADLFLQMREERARETIAARRGLTPSASSSRLLGGLSPPPRSVSARRGLASLANERSPTKAPPMVRLGSGGRTPLTDSSRRLSFGGMQEEEQEQDQIAMLAPAEEVQGSSAGVGTMLL